MDELPPSLHYGATKATLPEQNQFALFKLAHYRFFQGLAVPLEVLHAYKTRSGLIGPPVS
jgi:hypothetical protein